MTVPPPPTTPRQPSSTATAGPSSRGASGRTVETDSLGARITQAVMALVLAVVSVLLLLTAHRLRIDVWGIGLPVGLLFGAAFQVVISLFLWASTGARLPLLVLGSLWGVLALPFLGEGAGGGVLLPAALGDQVQYAGWIVQAIGLGIPFAVAGAITLAGRSRSRSRGR